MTRLRGIVMGSLVWMAAGASAFAQEASVPADPALDRDAERRAVLEVLAREEVRAVARVADVDLAAAGRTVEALEGERLERAASQARALERRLAAQDTISITTTTLIIILILIAIIIAVA